MCDRGTGKWVIADGTLSCIVDLPSPDLATLDRLRKQPLSRCDATAREDPILDGADEIMVRRAGEGITEPAFRHPPHGRGRSPAHGGWFRPRRGRVERLRLGPAQRVSQPTLVQDGADRVIHDAPAIYDTASETRSDTAGVREGSFQIGWESACGPRGSSLPSFQVCRKGTLPRVYRFLMV